MSPSYKMDVWGKIYALFSRYTDITPTIIKQIVANPGENFALYHQIASTHFTEKDILHLTSLVGELTEDDFKTGLVPLENQAPFWLTFYRNNGRYGQNKVTGRPKAGNEIDWTGIDWTQNNGEIARLKGCAPETVRVRRKKMEKMEIEKGIKNLP